MAVRKAQALWEGSLREGHGLMKFGSFEGPFSFNSRFEDGIGTNPEELIGAAHAGCYSMALSAGLGRAGFNPQYIQTNAHVTLDKVNGKSRITQIHLDCEASVPGIDAESFAQIAEETKSGCPVSVALTGVQISLAAKLV
jgi:osmotically inducible protein OsmC